MRFTEGGYGAEFRAIRTVIMIMVMLGTGTVSGAGQEPEDVEPGNRIALVAFLSYEGNIPLALSPTEMRVMGNDLLAARLESRGHEVVSYPELEPIMQARRIRTGSSLDLAFLRALADEHTVDRVLVATFVIYPDRLVVLSRGLDASTGNLVYARVAEEMCGDLWTDPAEAQTSWEIVISMVSMTIANTWDGQNPAGTSGTLIVLPVTPIGIGVGQAAMATYSLLGSVIETNRWSVPDPALVITALHADGHRPSSLEAEVRRELAAGFSAEIILISSLISFAQTPARVIPLLEEDEITQLPHQLESNIPVRLSLLVVDSTTGNVIAGDAEYLKPENPEGLFGVSNDIRVATRLMKGADRLVRILPEKEQTANESS